MALDDRYLTVPEVAAVFRVDPGTVRRWIVAGQMAAIQLPGRGDYRIAQREVERVLGVEEPQPAEAAS